MIENNIVELIVEAALFLTVFLLLPCAYRAYRGPSTADRILALDLITTLLISIIVLIAVLTNIRFLIDIGIALAALSFISTLALARYIAEGRVF